MVKRGSAGLRVGIQLVKSAGALEVCVVGVFLSCGIKML
ncbi:hypothetical protein ACUXPZ_002456 [Staphylococcus epidermidis]